jgi:hypothetical protein
MEGRVVHAAQLLLAPDGLVFCWIRAQRQPWLRIHYTAGAGYGNTMRACPSVWAAGEAKAVAGAYRFTNP